MLRITVGKEINSTFDLAMHRCRTSNQDVVVDHKGRPIMHFAAPLGQYSEIMVPTLTAPLGAMVVENAIQTGILAAKSKRQRCSNTEAVRWMKQFEAGGGKLH